MTSKDTPGSPAGAKACGCQAAFAFLVVVGLPLIFIYSFGTAPCAEGPCDPYGAKRLQNVAWIVAGLTLLVGLSAWRLASWWSLRQAAQGKDGRRQLALAGAGAGLLLLALFAFLITG